MKKKNRNILIMTSIIAVLIIMGLFFSNLLQTALGGGTILSVSSVNMLSSDSELGGKAYLVNIVINGGGEKIVGTITPEQISSFGITSIPAGDFQIEVELINYTCNYNINDDASTVYKLYHASVGQGCLAKDPPYGDITLPELIEFCHKNVSWDKNQITANSLVQGSAPKGGDCSKMVHINKLSTWLPEETNIVGGSVICYLHDCDRQRGTTPKLCEGLACYDQYRSRLDAWARSDSARNAYGRTTCCVSNPTTNNWGYSECRELDGNIQGDWGVTEIGGVPFYQGYAIDTSTEFDYIAKISITSPSGKKVIGTITPQKTSANLDNVAIVKFVGNLVSNKMCPIPAVDYTIVKDVKTNEMKAVKKVYYDYYKNELNNLLLLNIDHYVFTYRNAQTVTRVDPSVGGDVIFEQMSNLNAKLTMMFNDKSSLPNCKVSPTQTKLICTTDVAPVYPELQMKINADWLGVYTPKGNPVILSVTPPSSIMENTFAYASATIKNTGATDSFDVFFTCKSSSAQIPVRETIAKDETKTINVPIFSTYGSSSCILTVVSVNDDLKKATSSINISVTQRLVIFDLIKTQSIEKQALLEQMKILWNTYNTASEQDKISTREQINQVALKMEVILNSQKISIANYQKQLKEQLATLNTQLSKATTDTAKAQIQQQIDGITSQYAQLIELVNADADLNKQLQIEIDKGKLENKNFLLEVANFEATKFNTFYYIIGGLVVIIIGFIIYSIKKKKGKRSRR